MGAAFPSLLRNGGSAVNVSGTTSIGVAALSAGGNADDYYQGQGGQVGVTIEPGATVTTHGTSLSISVLAISAGNVSEVQPFMTGTVATYWPGAPGAVNVVNNGVISTAGTLSAGIAAISVGGAAIVTSAGQGTSYLGNSGPSIGADGSSVTVTNTGTIATQGSAAHGIHTSDPAPSPRATGPAHWLPRHPKRS